MRDSIVALLFQVLGQILRNQNRIMKHLGCAEEVKPYEYNTNTEILIDCCEETWKEYIER